MWWPAELDEDEETLYDYLFETSDGIRPEIDISWKEALEQNKTRDTCIICGKETVEKKLLSTTIKYCPCVEVMAEKEKKERGVD